MRQLSSDELILVSGGFDTGTLDPVFADPPDFPDYPDQPDPWDPPGGDGGDSSGGGDPNEPDHCTFTLLAVENRGDSAIHRENGGRSCSERICAN